MKQAILFFLCLISVNIHADECEPACREVNQAYNYWSYGLGPVPLVPCVGVGRRVLNNHYGWDISLNAGSIIYITTVQITANALYIPNPQADDPYYFGLGVAGGGVFGSPITAGTIAPNFLIGKEQTGDGNRKLFMEGHMQIPTKLFGHKKGKDTIWIPLFVIKTGVIF